MAQDNEWWHEFYPLFHPLFGLVPKRTTRAEVRFFVSKLGLRNGMSFLDCPCGIGRISIPMAQQGIRVTGIDIVPSFLDELNEKARRKKLSIRTFHNDMRRISFTNEFDAAGNLWTSFGLFERESDNLLTVKKMFQALKPGGKFMLHVINRDWIISHYQSNGWQEVAGLKVLETRHFDLATSINHCVHTCIKDGEEKQVTSDIRMYSYHELLAMFRKVGFVDIQGFGSIKDEPVSLRERMLIVIGTKPKRRRN